MSGGPGVLPSPLAFPAGLLGLAALAVTACGSGGDPTAPQPRKVFHDGFVTPLEAVEILADGGTIIGAYDAWLVMSADVPPLAKGDGDYRSIDCAPVVEYFERELALANRPLEVVLTNCREARNERLPFDNGRWLADGIGGERLFYRVWKYR
jgi:hypothetical protein